MEQSVQTYSCAICGSTRGPAKTPSPCRRILWTLLLACLLSAPITSARSEDSVRNFVERVNHASTALLASEGGGAQKCRRLLAWAFDVPAMARYALGTAWNKATSAQRRAFLAAFEDEIVSAYLRRMRAYRGATMSFVGARKPSGGNQVAASRLLMPNGTEQTWIWKLRPAGEGWRIVDVTIDGRSALHAERQEYADILESNHGDINAVIAFVRRRAG
jgi:phospholipid transport system substrate-binding protein